MHLNICHLYPFTMNTYGDNGNIICLEQRCLWRGITTTVHKVDIGDPIPPNIDLYFFGGGQDASQESVGEDLLQKKSKRLQEDAKANIPILAVCGGYQLLGNVYYPFNNHPIEGIGLLPVETRASHDRMIGNCIITAHPSLKLSDRSTLVGFENHSGKTTILSKEAFPLGTIRHGKGNNGEDKTEGCVSGTTIGCYLHGSVLPKNPHLADHLIQLACQRHEVGFQLAPLDDTLEWQTHDRLVDRYT